MKSTTLKDEKQHKNKSKGNLISTDVRKLIKTKKKENKRSTLHDVMEDAQKKEKVLLFFFFELCPLLKAIDMNKIDMQRCLHVRPSLHYFTPKG